MTQLHPRARRVLYYTLLDQLLGAGEVRIMYRDLGASQTADGGGLAPDRVFADRTEPDDNLVDTDSGCRTGGLIGRYDDPSIGNEIDSLAAAKTRSPMHRDRNVTIQIGRRLDCLPRRGTVCSMSDPFHGEVVRQSTSTGSEALQLAAASVASRVTPADTSRTSETVRTGWSRCLIPPSRTGPIRGFGSSAPPYCRHPAQQGRYE